ncbi:hypothetical protein LIER_02174 [Lithospermum erythrorhizon]|uniref:Uncharacterized protein n=1 Tax=Lithospermum erythrorhizon TaxID=34254 RepID=A0AAV3NNJ2_LITER
MPEYDEDNGEHVDNSGGAADFTDSKSQRIRDSSSCTYSNLFGNTGLVSGAAPAFPGLFPTMLPLAGQFGTLPVMPIQAMTQQATRHAR